MYDNDKEVGANELMQAIRDLAQNGVDGCDKRTIELIQRFKRHINGDGKYLVFYYP